MLYAAYGSNLHPIRLKDRLPSARLIGTAYSPDWSLGFHKRSKDESGKCCISRGSGGAHFAIFDISNDDKLALDTIEGVGNGYAEITLNFEEFGDCESYVAQASHIDEALQPYDWYKELVLAGARLHGFPDAYLRAIESVRAICDPDTERRAKQWETVNKVRLSIAIAAD